MAYTIIKSDGTVLTTIADGTINTNSTSLGLPGRNFAGWGQPFDTNFVRITENFASSNPPSNPIRGQLWFNTSNNTLLVCPADGQTNAAAWLTITSTVSGGSTSFGNVTVSGNLLANNISATNNLTANSISTSFLTVTANANIADANVTTANIGTLRTTNITTGAQSTPGTLTGTWTVSGTAAGNALIVSGGNLFASGNLIISNANSIRDPSGNPITFAGTYNDANVAAYLPTYGGNILTVQTRATVLTTGANTTPGTITGNWTLTTGSRLQATYADLAEKHEADQKYPIGTVMKVGGIKEITCVQTGDAYNVLGVVSNTYSYLMNSDAGNDETHPPVALIGRVPVRVVGPITKGDKVTAHANGCAIQSSTEIGFGWALETNSAQEEKLVLCVIK